MTLEPPPQSIPAKPMVTAELYLPSGTHTNTNKQKTQQMEWIHLVAKDVSAVDNTGIYSGHHISPGSRKQWDMYFPRSLFFLPFLAKHLHLQMVISDIFIRFEESLHF